MRSAVPGELAGYRIEGVLGEGGFGVVYAASRDGAEVALKVYRADLELTEREVARFVKEAEMLGAVDHPGVVASLGQGVLDDGRPYLVMPRLEGETLADRLDRGPIPLDRALAIFDELAAALTALHQADLVHRDLKPENVMLCDDRPVLLDLGIAKGLDDAPSTTTQAGRVRGTPAYMAPERFYGTPASQQSDIYELALVLYAMVVGRLPWSDPTSPAERHRPASPANAGVGPALAEAILSALALEPRDRPRSAQVFAAAVRQAAAADALLARSTTEAAIQAPPPRSLKPLRWGAPATSPSRSAEGHPGDLTPPGSAAAIRPPPRRWLAPALVAASLATLPWLIVRSLEKDAGDEATSEPPSASAPREVPPPPTEPPPEPVEPPVAATAAPVSTVVTGRAMASVPPTVAAPSSPPSSLPIPLGPDAPPPPAPWCDKLLGFFCSPDMVAYSASMCPTWKSVLDKNGRLYARIQRPEAHDQQCKNHYDTMVPSYRASMLAWKERQAEIAAKKAEREAREAERERRKRAREAER